MLASTVAAQHSAAAAHQDVAGAWEDARSTAAFASAISVNCMEEGHDGEECSIRTTANEIAARSLELARELTKSAVAA